MRPSTSSSPRLRSVGSNPLIRPVTEPAVARTSDTLAEELDQRPERHPLHTVVELERLIPRPAHGGARLAARRRAAPPARAPGADGTARHLHLRVPRPEVERVPVLAGDQLDAQVLHLEPRKTRARRGAGGPLLRRGAARLRLESRRRAPRRPSRLVPGRSTTVRICTSPGSSRPASRAVHRGRTRTRSISMTTGEPGSGAMRTGPKLEPQAPVDARCGCRAPRRPAAPRARPPPDRGAGCAPSSELSIECSAVTAVNTASASTAARCIQRRPAPATGARRTRHGCARPR